MTDSIDYRAVLEDLKSRKTALEQAIVAVEAMLGEVGDTSTNSGGGSTGKTIHPDAFVGLNILQAAAKYLQMVGRPARSTTEIANALNQGGLTVSQGSVSTILRRSDNGDSPVTRAARSLFGLSAWYPGKPRRNNKAANEESQ
jgi:hypothetical protein